MAPDWLMNRLSCMLSGSTKEVYETGSQVADLHLMLSAMVPPVHDGTWGALFRDTVLDACSRSFPDLAREMGLEILDSQRVNAKLMTAETDDKVGRKYHSHLIHKW